MNQPRSAGQIAIALTVALLGFLLATQLRAQQGLAQRLQIERESDLGQILSELTARNDQLVEELGDLRVRLATAAGSGEQERALEEAARTQLRTLQILLGIVPTSGQGITLTIADPQGTVGPDLVLDAIEELRDAGAEAIDVDGVRIVASSAFAGRTGAVTADGRVLKSPYVVTAIGASATLAEAMKIPGGVIDAITARDGASVRVTRARTLKIASVKSAPTFTYARPVPRR
jgi:uncharacterized protein YlxW (UPF0749 family)